MKFYSLFSLAVFLLILSPVSGESHSNHRLDDSLYSSGGRKNITHENRLHSVLEVSGSETHGDGFSFYNMNFLNTKFFSQKGGDNSQKAAKNLVSGIASPEFTFSFSKNSISYYLIASPILVYSEKAQVKKEISREADFEAIGGFTLNPKMLSLTFEAGRGFQRLDSFGLFFSGISNFANATFQLKGPGLSFSFLGASFDYKNKEVITAESISNGNKLYGGSILFKKLPFLNWLNFFSYKLHEPLQVARPEAFRFSREDFHPLGNFVYSGLELESKPLKNFARSDFGFIGVKGYRDKGEYSNQKYNSRISTFGYLGYFQECLDFDKLKFRFGILKSSKDKVSRTDRESNGYAGLITEPRIFGGRSSFFLNESIEPVNEKIFGEINEKQKSNFENKGIQITHLGATFNPISSLDVSLIFNHSLSRIGIGKELIILGQYSLDKPESIKKSFLLFSACVANVKSYKQDNLFFNELPKSESNREFVRFHFSGVVAF